MVRENVYAGLAGFYFIRDNRDTGLANNPITLPPGAQEAELMLADRQFDTNGQLYFPDSGQPGEPERRRPEIPTSTRSGSRSSSATSSPSTARAWPVDVRRAAPLPLPRASTRSNARFYTMQLFNQQGVDMHTNGPAGPAIWQIGSDGGFFNNPVKLADPANGTTHATVSPPTTA